MRDINKLLQEANANLNNKIKQLEILESEKKKIIEMYETAKPTEKILLEVEMKKSIKNYKQLLNEVLNFSKNVKKFKKSNC